MKNHFKEMQSAIKQALRSNNFRMPTPLEIELAVRIRRGGSFIVLDNGHVEPLENMNKNGLIPKCIIDDNIKDI